MINNNRPPLVNRNNNMSGPNKGTKQLVIKPFKTQPKLPINFENDTWEKLKSALIAVHNKTSTIISKEELYRAVEDLCMHKLGVTIYDKLKIECSIHTNDRVDALVGSTSDHSSYLSLVDTVWTDHCDSMNTIRNIFLYLDRTVVSSSGVKNLWDLGVEQFKLRFEFQKEVEHKTIVSLLAAIDAERQGLSIDREMIRRILRMLTSIGSYIHRFEIPLLTESKRFFLIEGQNLIEKLEPASFLLHVEKRLQEASEMVLRYLEISTRNALFTVIETNLLTPHVNQLVDRGLGVMLEGDKLVDLGRMYMLLEKVDVTSILKSQWSSHIRRIGEALISDVDPEREKNMIEELLKFQERMNSVLKNSFNNHEGYRQVLKTSFEQFINSRQNRPAELLAKYIDKKLRGEKGLDDVSTELILEKAMSLFRFLNGKDIFEGFYKKLLAKRLLLNKSSSVDLEKSMVTRLKTECGSGYTAKLEGMFLDIELSRENSIKFNESQNNDGNGKYIGEPDADIHVLTIGYWPAFPNSDTVIVPPLLLPIMTRYENFFSNNYQGRRLIWAHSLEKCVLSGFFPKGKKELDVSFYQAIVLLCFNKETQLNFNKIKLETGIDDSELRLTLASLANGVIGTRVLCKEPKGKEVNDTDNFIYNSDFTNKLFRVKINSIQLKEKEAEESDRTIDEVFRDRQYQVDAIIVRTMKSRKTLTHNELMTEMLTQLKFPARTSDLKKRIESLIERDYLQRDKDDNTKYNYMA